MWSPPALPQDLEGPAQDCPGRDFVVRLPGAVQVGVIEALDRLDRASRAKGVFGRPWWWTKRKRRVATSTTFTPSTTTPIQGIPELERCREALIEYMAINEKVIGSATVAGATKLYPYLADLCRILDEQEIPHPTLHYRGPAMLHTGIWSRFLGDLWAARHDIEKARRVYQPPPLSLQGGSCS